MARAREEKGSCFERMETGDAGEVEEIAEDVTVLLSVEELLSS